MRRFVIILAAVACFGPFAGKAAAAESADSVAVANDGSRLTEAVATILGGALTGSVDNIERLGVKVDRKQLISYLDSVINGGKTGFTDREADAYIDEYITQQRENYYKTTFSAEAQKAYCDSIAAIEGVVTTPTGLVFQTVVEGEGVNPADNDRVSITYTGSLSDGTVFDETDGPVVFDVARLVPGFTEALHMMKPGGTYRFVVPASLGYGADGVPGAIPPNAALDFTLKLLEVIPTPTNQ